VGLALLGHVGADSAEPEEAALVVEHRCARKLPPAPSRIDLDLHEQIRKILATLQPFRQIVQARRELAALPRVASDQLDERSAVQRSWVAPQRITESRAGRADPAIGIDLPKPIRVVLLKFTQQQ